MAVATIVDLGTDGGQPIQFTCHDAVTIEKGTLLAFVDPRTVSGAAADNVMFAGVAAHEKVADDGSTTIAVYQEGLFDIDSLGTIAAGNQVTISAANIVKIYTAGDNEVGYCVGRALETGPGTILIAIKGPFNG